MKQVKVELRRTLAMLLALVMLFIQLGLTASAGKVYDRVAPAGTGTLTSPYRISTVENLYWFADQVNSGNTGINAVLLNDLNLNPGAYHDDDALGNDIYHNDKGNPVNYDPFAAWYPIGNGDHTYTGTFNGNGHAVYGIYTRNAQKLDYLGFFGRIGGGCNIINLKVSGVLDNTSQSMVNVGGIAGCAVSDDGEVNIIGCTSNLCITITSGLRRAAST